MGGGESLKEYIKNYKKCISGPADVPRKRQRRLSHQCTALGIRAQGTEFPTFHSTLPAAQGQAGEVFKEGPRLRIEALAPTSAVARDARARLLQSSCGRPC